MSVKELKLPRGLTTLRVNDMHDGSGAIVLHIDSGMNSLLTSLDRAQQHLLMLYLQERLK